MAHSLCRTTLLGLFVVPSFFACYASDRLADTLVSHSEEQEMARVFTSLSAFELPDALQSASQLSARFPTYRMAHMLKADLLAIQAGRLDLVSAVRKANEPAVNDLIKEAKLRWQTMTGSGENDDERRVLKVAALGSLVLINTKTHRLYVYRQTDQGLVLQDDFYVSIGEQGAGKQKQGDLKTPTGIYRINDWRPGSGLPDLYGDGALTLNYPNAWDVSQGRTGYGIWLHGTPSATFTRAPRASKGCVVLTNPAIRRLNEQFLLGKDTLVMILSGDDQVDMAVNKHALRGIMETLVMSEKDIVWPSLTIIQYPSEPNLYYSIYRNPKNEIQESFWKKVQGEWRELQLKP